MILAEWNPQDLTDFSFFRDAVNGSRLQKQDFLREERLIMILDPYLHSNTILD